MQMPAVGVTGQPKEAGGRKDGLTMEEGNSDSCCTGWGAGGQTEAVWGVAAKSAAQPSEADAGGGLLGRR